MANRKKRINKIDQAGVRLEPELKQQLDTIARNEDRTISQVVRIAVKEFLERRNQPSQGAAA